MKVYTLFGKNVGELETYFCKYCESRMIGTALAGSFPRTYFCSNIDCSYKKEEKT